MKKRFCLLLITLCIVLSIGQALGEGRATDTMKKVSEVVAAQVHSGMSDYEKALALHDWLIEHVEYQLSSLSDFYADAALLDGYGVCQSYSNAYALLLGKAGIKNQLVSTSIHSWNLVLLDGEWYHIDCTSDDSGGNPHRYFALSDYAIGSTGESGSTYSNAYQNNYAYRTGLLDSFINQYTSTIQTMIDEGNNEFLLSVTDSIPNDSENIYKRTALLAVCDHTYQVNGISQKITITTNGDYELRISTVPKASDENNQPVFSPMYMAAPIILDTSYHPQVRVSIIADDGSGSYAFSVRIVRNDGTVFMERESLGYMPTAEYYLPNGTYTIRVYGTDGMTETEITDELEIDVSYSSLLRLPASLQRIEAETFANLPMVYVECGNKLQSIGEAAFSGCSYLRWITIPESVTYIADDAFLGCTDLQLIIGKAGSYAEKYAEEQGVFFVALK